MKRMLIVALFGLGLALTMAATATAAYQTDITPAYVVANGYGVGIYLVGNADPAPGYVYVSSWSPLEAPGGVTDNNGDNVTAAPAGDFSMTVADGGAIDFNIDTPVPFGELLGATITYTGTVPSSGLRLIVVAGSEYVFNIPGAGGVFTLTEGTSISDNIIQDTLAYLQANPGLIGPGITDNTPVIFNINSGTVGTSSFSSIDITTTTPEPISMIFFGTGLAAVGGYMARRKMAHKA